MEPVAAANMGIERDALVKLARHGTAEHLSALFVTKGRDRIQGDYPNGRLYYLRGQDNVAEPVRIPARAWEDLVDDLQAHMGDIMELTASPTGHALPSPLNYAASMLSTYLGKPPLETVGTFLDALRSAVEAQKLAVFAPNLAPRAARSSAASAAAAASSPTAALPASPLREPPTKRQDSRPSPSSGDRDRNLRPLRQPPAALLPPPVAYAHVAPAVPPLQPPTTTDAALEREVRALRRELKTMRAAHKFQRDKALAADTRATAADARADAANAKADAAEARIKDSDEQIKRVKAARDHCSQQQTKFSDLAEKWRARFHASEKELDAVKLARDILIEESKQQPPVIDLNPVRETNVKKRGSHMRYPDRYVVVVFRLFSLGMSAKQVNKSLRIFQYTWLPHLNETTFEVPGESTINRWRDRYTTMTKYLANLQVSDATDICQIGFDESKINQRSTINVYARIGLAESDTEAKTIMLGCAHLLVGETSPEIADTVEAIFAGAKATVQAVCEAAGDAGLDTYLDGIVPLELFKVKSVGHDTCNAANAAATVLAAKVTAGRQQLTDADRAALGPVIDVKCCNHLRQLWITEFKRHRYRDHAAPDAR